MSILPPAQVPQGMLSCQVAIQLVMIAMILILRQGQRTGDQMGTTRMVTQIVIKKKMEHLRTIWAQSIALLHQQTHPMCFVHPSLFLTILCQNLTLVKTPALSTVISSTGWLTSQQGKELHQQQQVIWGQRKQKEDERTPRKLQEELDMQQRRWNLVIRDAAGFSGSSPSKHITKLCNIVYALGMANKGTTDQLIALTKSQFKANPALKDKSQFAGLFSCSQKLWQLGMLTGSEIQVQGTSELWHKMDRKAKRWWRRYGVLGAAMVA